MNRPPSGAGRPLSSTLLLLGAAASTWTELAIGSLFVSDMLIFGAGVALMVSLRAPGERHASSQQVADLLLMAAVFLVSSSVLAVLVRDASLGQIGVAIQLVIALTILPLILAEAAAREDNPANLWSAVITAVFFSATISSAFAVADFLLGLQLSPAQRTWSAYLPLAESRAVGLTGHPNLLGLSTAIALPLAPALLAFCRSRTQRIMVVACSLLVAGGLLLSGSRGALAGLIAAVAWSALKGGYKRRAKRTARLAIPVVLLFIALLRTGAGPVQRLLGDDSAAMSNQARLEGLRQAASGLESTAIVGAGFDQLVVVHSGLLAIVVSGGILAVLGTSLWAARVVAAARSARATGDAVLTACVASAVAYAASLLVSPMIYHRYALLPPAVLIASHLQAMGKNSRTRATSVITSTRGSK